MKTVEERAYELFPIRIRKSRLGIAQDVNEPMRNVYIQGLTEQRTIDHSKEHVIWLIKQYHDWEYEKGHDMDTESWEEWLSKALKEL